MSRRVEEVDHFFLIAVFSSSTDITTPIVVNGRRRDTHCLRVLDHSLDALHDGFFLDRLFRLLTSRRSHHIRPVHAKNEAAAASHCPSHSKPHLTPYSCFEKLRSHLMHISFFSIDSYGLFSTSIRPTTEQTVQIPSARAPKRYKGKSRLARPINRFNMQGRPAYFYHDAAWAHKKGPFW